MRSFGCDLEHGIGVQGFGCDLMQEGIGIWGRGLGCMGYGHRRGAEGWGPGCQRQAMARRLICETPGQQPSTYLRQEPALPPHRQQWPCDW